MFPEQLKKILKLIKKTGDRVVIYDPSAPDDSYVILDFDRYSNMVGQDSPKESKESTESTEPIEPQMPIVEAPKYEPKSLPRELLEELLIVDRKSLINQKELLQDLVKDSIKSENLTENDLTDKINREISMWKNRDDSAFLGEENKPKKAWQIPSQVKNNAQNIE